jgi:hypothetical protein
MTYSKMSTSKTSPEKIYGWKHYTEKEVGLELNRLYKDRNFIEFSISLGFNQLENYQHKFGVHIQAKICDIEDYLQKFYKELDQIESEIAYFECQQAYYDEIQMRNEDCYPYY